MAPDQLVVIGRLGRPHGVGGEIRAHPTGPTLALLAVGDRVHVIPPDGVSPRELEIVVIRPTAGSLLMRFGGADTREAASALTGSTIGVPEERRARLTEPDEYYVSELIGCVVAIGPRDLGEVVDVHEGAANDAFVVRGPDGEEVMVPFTRDAIEDLDLTARRIRIRADLFAASDDR
jgi:16S rRNA processing protein RimM